MDKILRNGSPNTPAVRPIPNQHDTSLDQRSEQQHKAYLNKLAFSNFDERKRRIVDATLETFEWAFQSPNLNTKPWASFASWLQCAEPLYWIAGKAGSGKSTLMKFLQQDTRTVELLRIWAGGHRLVTGWFYFWNSGSTMQQSLEGLLRTLLHDVATQLPDDSIAVLSPQRWEMTRVFEDDTAPWTMPECIETLERLTEAEFRDYRFAFFVDGLDEFGGDHNEVVSLLQKLAAHDHIKVCASSRPWNLFQDSFDMSPSLRVEDLSATDIEIYVDKTFHNNARFCTLERLSPDRTGDLSRQISQRAAGVFLWVKLVVRELLLGIQDGDRLSDLQRRLDVMPSDLYAFFFKILSNITEDGLNNFQQAAELFRIRHTEEVSVFAMALADNDDPDHWVKSPTPPSDDEINWIVDSMTRRLNSKTRGLLEMDDCTCSSYLIQNHLGRPVDAKFLAESKVQYLHRTVRDFIETPETMAKLQEHTFDPNLALCKSYVLQVRFFETGNGRQEQLNTKIRTALGYAQAVDESNNRSLHNVLDALSDWMYVVGRHERFRREPMLKHPRQLPALLPTALGWSLKSWVSHCLHTSLKGLLASENKRHLSLAASWLNRYSYTNHDGSLFLDIAHAIQAQGGRHEPQSQDDRDSYQILGASARLQLASGSTNETFVAAPFLDTRAVVPAGTEESLTDVELPESEMPCTALSLPPSISQKRAKRREKTQDARTRIEQRRRRQYPNSSR
jgi:hypothetical protein